MDVQRRTSDIVAQFSSSAASAADLLCDRHPEAAVAFRFLASDGSRTDLTYGDLAATSRSVASGLRALGIRSGDRVATLAGKSVHLPALLLGIWRAGAVYVPLFTAFAADIVAERLFDSRARVVIADAANISKVPARPNLTLVTDAGGVSGAHSLKELLRHPDDGLPAHATGGEQPIAHMFTSGTTGKPKGVVHPLTYLAGWQAYVELVLAVSPGSSFWCAADPGWAYGLYTAILGPLAAGVPTLSVEGGFDPARTWAVLESEAVTDFTAGPTVYRSLRAAGRPQAFRSSLRRLSSAGEPLTPDVSNWTLGEFGIPVHDHFGQTETGMTLGFPHLPQIAVHVEGRAMGAPLPGWTATVLEVDSNDDAPPDTVGRLAIDPASPFMSFGGYAGAAESSSRFTADGRWYLTGDLASRDSDGVFHFVSRDDDIILMAGYRIGPADIETVLLTHPAVVECAIVAVPDEIRGEVIVAHVVLGDPAVASDALTGELQDLVRTKYARHAYPRRVTYWPALPKTPSGKIKRAELRAAEAGT